MSLLPFTDQVSLLDREYHKINNIYTDTTNRASFFNTVSQFTSTTNITYHNPQDKLHLPPLLQSLHDNLLATT